MNNWAELASTSRCGLKASGQSRPCTKRRDLVEFTNWSDQFPVRDWVAETCKWTIGALFVLAAAPQKLPGAFVVVLFYNETASIHPISEARAKEGYWNTAADFK